jgi:hypothetical protein
MIQYQVEVLNICATPAGTSGGRMVLLDPDRVFVAGRIPDSNIHLPFAGVSPAACGIWGHRGVRVGA